MSGLRAPDRDARHVGDVPSPVDPAQARLANRVMAERLILLVGAWAVLPPLVQTLTAPKYRGRIGELAPPSSRLADLANAGLTLLVLAGCVLAVVQAVHDRRDRRLLPLALLLAPWVYVVVRDLFARDLPTPYALVYPAAVVALWALRPPLESLRMVGYVAGAAAVVGVALGFGLPSKGVFYYVTGELVSEGKATLPWGILVGHFTHGNKLGGFLALGLPWLLLVPRRSVRFGLLAVTVFALYWSASRGSMGAFVAGLLVMVLLVVVRPRVRPALGAALVAGSLAVASVIPLVVARPELFSNRGLIWMHSTAWWMDSFWFGLGTAWYSDVGGTTQRIAATAFHGHNQFIHLAVTGGVVLLALCAALLALVTVRAVTAPGRTVTVAVGYLVALTVVGVLERPFGLVDNTSFFPVVMLPLAVLALSAPATRDDDPGPLEGGVPGPKARKGAPTGH